MKPYCVEKPLGHGGAGPRGLRRTFGEEARCQDFGSRLCLIALSLLQVSDRGRQVRGQRLGFNETAQRTEQAILDTYVSEIVALTGACELIELGSGSSRKTHTLLTAYSQLDDPLHYYPIDVSAGILRTTALNLLDTYPQLNVCGVAGTYERALAQLPPRIIENRMLMFLGSTMGNLDDRSRDIFLTQVQQALQPGEFFLLGLDLQKPIHILEAAYNDAQGITAAFNLNVLRHLNDRFDGNFNLDRFAHLAFFNDTASQIEMHLKSLTNQTVKLTALNLEISLKSGETIHTEISRKFNLPELTDTLTDHALQPINIWTDPQSWFGLILCQRQCLLSQDCP